MFYVLASISRNEDDFQMIFSCYDNNIRKGDAIVTERNAKTKYTTRPIKFQICWVKNVLTEAEGKKYIHDQQLEDIDILDVVCKVDFSAYDTRKQQRTVCGDPLPFDIKQNNFAYLIGERLNEFGDEDDNQRYVKAKHTYQQELNALENSNQNFNNPEIICVVRHYKSAINYLQKKIA